MTKSAVETPQTYARIAGAIYLVIIAVGLFGEGFVRQQLIVAGDATATAMNISAAQSLWHMSIGAELAYIFGAVVSTWILYLLLKPATLAHSSRRSDMPWRTSPSRCTSSVSVSA
jgi:hypothetical protein